MVVRHTLLQNLNVDSTTVLICSYVMLGNTSFSSELRNLIVQTVSNDHVTFNEAFLGKSNKDYCDWIANPERWGGMGFSFS